MKTVVQVASVAAILLLVTVTAVAQDTLADTVRRQQGPVEVHVTREFSPVDLADLILKADLIARVVIIGDGRSRLSETKRSLVTDYQVQIVETLRNDVTIDLSKGVTVTKPGGEMTIDGFRVACYESDFPELHAGEEYVLFLKYDRSSEMFMLPYGAQGAFRNNGGLVEQVSRNFGKWNRERGQVPLVGFTEEIGRAVRPQ